MSHELSAEIRGRIIDQQTEALRSERYATELRIACLEGLPDDLLDGSEEEGIETLNKRLRVIDSQIETIEAQMPAEPRNRAEKRAAAKRAPKGKAAAPAADDAE